jgi:hypothetical protein
VREALRKRALAGIWRRREFQCCSSVMIALVGRGMLGDTRIVIWFRILDGESNVQAQKLCRVDMMVTNGRRLPILDLSETKRLPPERGTSR